MVASFPTLRAAEGEVEREGLISGDVWVHAYATDNLNPLSTFLVALVTVVPVMISVAAVLKERRVHATIAPACTNQAPSQLCSRYWCHDQSVPQKKQTAV